LDVDGGSTVSECEYSSVLEADLGWWSEID